MNNSRRSTNTRSEPHFTDKTLFTVNEKLQMAAVAATTSSPLAPVKYILKQICSEIAAREIMVIYEKIYKMAYSCTVRNDMIAFVLKKNIEDPRNVDKIVQNIVSENHNDIKKWYSHITKYYNSFFSNTNTLADFVRYVIHHSMVCAQSSPKIFVSNKECVHMALLEIAVKRCKLFFETEMISENSVGKINNYSADSIFSESAGSDDSFAENPKIVYGINRDNANIFNTQFS